MKHLVRDLESLRSLIDVPDKYRPFSHPDDSEDKLSLFDAMREVLRIQRVRGPEFSQRHGAMYAQLRRTRNSVFGLNAWAQHPHTSHSDILALLDQAIASAREPKKE